MGVKYLALVDDCRREKYLDHTCLYYDKQYLGFGFAGCKGIEDEEVVLMQLIIGSNPRCVYFKIRDLTRLPGLVSAGVGMHAVFLIFECTVQGHTRGAPACMHPSTPDPVLKYWVPGTYWVHTPLGHLDEIVGIRDIYLFRHAVKAKFRV
eukprot:Gb_20702 [translate_table: standard]